MARKDDATIARRSVLAAASGFAALPMLASEAATAWTRRSGGGRTGAAGERRRLGSLEVSSIGLGVQNMHRKYTPEVPYRPEMIAIIRAAFDHGTTFFDTAEAYGPLECERILGEAIQPVRNRVAITSKFGWNIDPETGQRLPG